jgi:hypothetical protein
MSLNTLLESANPYKSVQSDAARLASKWEATGLLEGLEGSSKNNMGMILENQAKQLVVEQSQTNAGGAHFEAGEGAQWAGVALPLVRKVFGQIAAQEFVSVQPMNLPSGLVFYLDFQYGTAKEGFSGSVYGDAGAAPFGNTDEGGLYGAGRFGYSINNASASAVTVSAETISSASVNYDSRIALEDYQLVSVAVSDLPEADLDAVRSFAIDGVEALSQFTTVAGTDVLFVVPVGYTPADETIVYSRATADNARGDFEDRGAGLAIPEINVNMKSSAIVAKTRKLKAVWTPEFAQDLNAYHALDAEAELTSILSEYISLEIDLEILDMLMANAAAGTENWSAVNNTSVGSADDLGFFNTQGQWFQTLGTKIQKLSNTIHQKTLRGGANFLVCSPAVATILESIPGFAADTDGDAAKMNYAFGVQKVGQLNSRQKVYKNPYMKENTILLGFRGAQFLESGAVFAPYIPLIMTPLVYDPETFTPRKGLLTRYAKKMVRPEFYGTINVAGLETL